MGTVELVCHGLDTYATVTLNGTVLGSTNNIDDLELDAVAFVRAKSLGRQVQIPSGSAAWHADKSGIKQSSTSAFVLRHPMSLAEIRKRVFKKGMCRECERHKARCLNRIQEGPPKVNALLIDHDSKLLA